MNRFDWLIDSAPQRSILLYSMLIELNHGHHCVSFTGLWVTRETTYRVDTEIWQWWNNDPVLTGISDLWHQQGIQRLHGACRQLEMIPCAWKPQLGLIQREPLLLKDITLKPFVKDSVALNRSHWSSMSSLCFDNGWTWSRYYPAFDINIFNSQQMEKTKSFTKLWILK